jgi:hypothetical protein
MLQLYISYFYNLCLKLIFFSFLIIHDLSYVTNQESCDVIYKTEQNGSIGNASNLYLVGSRYESQQTLSWQISVGSEAATMVTMKNAV